MQLKSLSFFVILSFVSAAGLFGCGEAMEPTQPDSQTKTLGGDEPPNGVEDCGKVTGGGFVYRYAAEAKVTFGFNAMVTKRGDVRGHITVIDHWDGWEGGPLHLNSTELTGFSAPRENTRIFSGLARVNGKEDVEFAVKVVDNGEPGRHDKFFLLFPGYNVSGWLLGGNIQIHHPRWCQSPNGAR